MFRSRLLQLAKTRMISMRLTISSLFIAVALTACGGGGGGGSSSHPGDNPNGIAPGALSGLLLPPPDKHYISFAA